MIGSMEPITDAHPLTAHAQGMRGFLDPLKTLMPSGKGIPMSNPNGAMIRNVIKTLVIVGRLKRKLSRCEAKPYSGDRKEMLKSTSLCFLLNGVIHSEK